MANLRISDLGTAPTVEETDLVEIAEVDGESPSGYSSYKTTILGIANKIATSTVFWGLVTTAKNIVGAINEIVNGFDDNVIDVIKDLKQVRSATITDGIATFDDVLEVNPLVEATATFSPKQDLHGYDAPWAGGNGKNKYIGSPSFDGYNNRSLWTLSSETYNGHEVIQKTTSWFGVYKQIPVTSGKTYTFSAMIKLSANGIVYVYNKNNKSIKNMSITTPDTWVKISVTFTANDNYEEELRVENNNSEITLYVSEYQLEEGSTATDYAPYSNYCPISGWDGLNLNVSDGESEGTDYPATFSDTVYGGNYDFVSGDGASTKGTVDLSLLTYAQGDGYLQVTKDSVQAITGLNPKRSSSLPGQDNISDICLLYSTANQFRFMTNLTVSEFLEIASGHMLCYELATPTPIELTGQEVTALEGVNVVSTDGDGMSSVKYKKMNL